MSTLQKGILWMTGCLVFVFALSIGLSWYSYGELDLGVVAQMGMMLLPVLGAACAIILWTERAPAQVEKGEAPRDAKHVHELEAAVSGKKE